MCHLDRRSARNQQSSRHGMGGATRGREEGGGRVTMGMVYWDWLGVHVNGSSRHVAED